ncbi:MULTISPECIES: efflux RND transporter permease subunit [Gordonibacter]|uniref:MMPL family transporter n=1 Tax=Gordonibacter faecis TaxID=3047475 RepID=A0ABT7DPC5_9ACTN|nr:MULTISPECIES: MMPL family transporter [unclassified Gordonibacter]MDJ1651402.1 MMPL family transporter [Gordonibacter sp. KGMB12511]HIW75995.1 MMPL family transporter [Candidatus Gordonibacter avicola]
MDRFTAFVTGHRIPIVVVTLLLAAAAGVAALFVPINYDLTSYLPESTESTRALEQMNAEFDASVPNARVMVNNVDVEQALTYKHELAAAQGVEGVLWLDDVADLGTPLEMLDQATVEQYYRDGHALFDVTVAEGEETEALQAIYDVVGEDGSATGQAINTAESEAMAGSEVANAFAILVPLILLILIISTTSWIEPVFFLLAIGVSVLLNMGTNIFLGEVSYIAFTIAPILQLAVSLDYAIFLLHAFQREREKEPDAVLAMRRAMKQSFSAIAASAATTMFGFAALGFMQFRIGADLGITLCKGIVFSFICVVVFLPAFTLAAYKLIDKTHHRRFLPTFKGVGKVLAPLRIPVFALVLVLVVPCAMAQASTQFTYGMGSTEGSQTRVARDTAAINDTFGQSTPAVVLVPKGDMGRELELAERLEQIPHVTSVLSYPMAVGSQIPTGFLDPAVTEQFYSEHDARLVVYADTESEGTTAFGVLEQVRNEVRNLYGDQGLTAGMTASLYDMKGVVTEDNKVTNLIAIAAILLVLLLTFKSATLPVILIATIESAIFINLSVPYFTGESLNYLGFLVINTVQLGATVDYAILFTDTYRTHRRSMPAREALARTLGTSFQSILVSASILTAAGLVLWLTSTNNIVSLLGLLLARGTLLSFFLVVTFLPAALLIFDKLIAKTTWRAGFFRAGSAADGGTKSEKKEASS